MPSDKGFLLLLILGAAVALTGAALASRRRHVGDRHRLK